ncbi:MAG: hypothetical protein IRZ16_06525 [Myxococcaceae bacterium]|nr:hypothetical protein [Myxococcaceae bacterium]
MKQQRDERPGPGQQRSAQPSCAPKQPYCKPAILWEQEFVALAQISNPCTEPGSGPNCFGPAFSGPE